MLKRVIQLATDEGLLFQKIKTKTKKPTEINKQEALKKGLKEKQIKIKNARKTKKEKKKK